jgi:hypothetical protein
MRSSAVGIWRGRRGEGRGPHSRGYNLSGGEDDGQPGSASMGNARPTGSRYGLLELAEQLRRLVQSGAVTVCHVNERIHMNTTTLIIIIVLLLVFGGGWGYSRRGRR